MVSVMRYTEVSDTGSTSLSAAFFCVMTHADVAPRTAMAVCPVAVDALMAYSVRAEYEERTMWTRMGNRGRLASDYMADSVQDTRMC